MESREPDSNATTSHGDGLKHYDLRQCLGEGGFGQVFEAWDSKLCRPVAIKRLKNLGVLPNQQALIKEARLAASLHHAAFVKIHALEDDQHSQAIVMELVHGQTLKQVLAERGPSVETALDMVRQIAQAMQEAHAAGLTHGDLKPSNLMLEASGRVRILDFGLASQADLEATTSMLEIDPQGTIAYMAPERLHGAPLTPLADIYALGVILYELCTGARPFAHLSGLTLAAALVQSSSEQWAFPATMAQELVQLVRAMTAKLPGQRLQSMSLVATQLPAVRAPGVHGSDEPVAQIESAGMAMGALASPNKVPTYFGRKFRLPGAVLVICLLVVGGWKLSPWVPGWLAAAKPFSESLAMKNGTEALRLYDRPGQLDNAVKNFSAILERNPENAAAIAGIAVAYSLRYLSDGQDDVWRQKADAGAQQAMKLNDQLAFCYVAKGWALRIHGKQDLALPVFEQALALEPDNWLALLGKITVLRRLRRFSEARQAIELAMKRFPEERVFVDESGMLFYEQRNFRAAEQAFKASIRLKPDATYAYANLNAALLQQDRLEEGLQVLQQGLQIQPSATLYTSLGNAQMIRGDYVAAARAFENAVSPTKGNPVDYMGWANFGDALLRLPGRVSEAHNAHEKAYELLTPQLSRTKNDFVVVSRMALYAARTGRKAEAEVFIEQARNLAPNDPGVHFRLGLAYELLGNRSSALATIAKAKALGYPAKLIEAEPDLAELRHDQGYLQK